MSDRRVVRDVPTATLETAAALTGKMDGGAAEAYKVPQKAKRLIAIEASLSPEAALAITENNVGLRLQGDGLPGGPYYYVLGHVATSGTTSGQAMSVGGPIRIPVDLAVVPGATIDGDVFPVGDTITVTHCMVALVFEE